MHAAFKAALADELGLVLRLLAQLQGDAAPAGTDSGVCPTPFWGPVICSCRSLLHSCLY